MLEIGNERRSGRECGDICAAFYAWRTFSWESGNATLIVFFCHDFYFCSGVFYLDLPSLTPPSEKSN
jgi:hypothetical protein